MNATLILVLLRQRWHSPVRLTLAIVFFIFPLLTCVLMPVRSFNPGSAYFVLVLGGGMVGQDVTSGVLSCVFARPLRRSAYALSRWLAVALGASVLVVAQAVAALAILVLRGAGPDVADMGMRTAGAVLAMFGISAVLLLFSSLLNGLGDLALYAVGYVAEQIFTNVGSALSWAWLERAGDELSGFLAPRLDVAQLSGTGFSAFALISYVSTVVLCLALSIVLLNRKELTYAAG